MPIDEVIEIECKKWMIRTTKLQVNEVERYVCFVGSVVSGRLRSAADWHLIGSEAEIRLRPYSPDEGMGSLTLRDDAEADGSVRTIEGLLTLEQGKFDRLISEPPFTMAKKCLLQICVGGGGYFEAERDSYRSSNDRLSVKDYSIDFTITA